MSHVGPLRFLIHAAAAMKSNISTPPRTAISKYIAVPASASVVNPINGKAQHATQPTPVKISSHFDKFFFAAISHPTLYVALTVIHGVDYMVKGLA